MTELAKPRLVGFNHVALEVGDIEEALAFYGRLFAFELRGKSDSMAFIVNRRGKGPPDRRAKGTPWLVTDRGGSVRPCGASWDCAAGASAVGLGADC